MDNNFSVKILESYMDIDKLHDDINNKLFHFITKATELVESSEDMYQIEKTIKLNKISLKGYILDSPCCSFLKENNVLDYTIEELKSILQDILKNFAVKKAILFGSYAKNTPTSKSDIDLVIDSEGKLLNIYFYGLLEDLVQKLQKNIDLFEISEIQKNSRIYNDIQNEGVVVYEK